MALFVAIATVTTTRAHALPGITWSQSVHLHDVVTQVLIALFNIQHTSETVGDGCGVVGKRIGRLGFIKL
jgi:hypothetical protein